MTTTGALPLAAMQAEVAEYVEAMGWNENPVSFAAAMALLHSEASEAVEAWRVHGLEDFTCRGHVHTHGYGDKLCKPEGVGSEFADILIRALDDSDLFGLDTAGYVEAGQDAPGAGTGFLEDMNTLHGLIARVSLANEAWGADAGAALASVITFLRQLSVLYGIDLQAEYFRKMAYNRTRPHRHGGKRA
jgi:NTP pyrophosphatase (non-canonical NTP hydrolase)